MSLVLLLSGPNLNLLGEREPEVYGTDTLADHVKRAEAAAGRRGLDLEHLQSNHEGELVEAVHRARGRADALDRERGRAEPHVVVAARCRGGLRRPGRGAAHLEPRRP